MKNTVIISAFPACGKTYAYNTYEDITMLDSDSSEFSWIKDENGNNTKERNPDFPNNYIKHIKDNIGKVDVIFVSSHLNVRQAMADNNIDYITIYPQEQCRLSWIGRMYLRGNDANFISFINDNWNKFMSDIKKEPHGMSIFLLWHNDYLDRKIINRAIVRNKCQKLINKPIKIKRKDLYIKTPYTIITDITVFEEDTFGQGEYMVLSKEGKRLYPSEFELIDC